MMKTSDFNFDLPQELIAQDPLEDRSSSRLMVLNKESGEIAHRIFHDITEYLHPGDCLVINDTKVIPARLIGTKEDTGAHIEILLLKRKENDVWETLVKPGKKCRPGARVVFGNGELKAEIVDVLEDGNRLVHFEYEGIFEEVLDRLGQMPLPPYITHKLQDKNRYQTVYAKYEGSAAAPTAGLHFTKELLKQILSGTEFKVEEINLNNQEYKVPTITVSGCKDVVTSNNIATGTIELGNDASVLVTNHKNYKVIKVEKQWKDSRKSDGTGEGNPDLEDDLKPQSTFLGLYYRDAVQPEQVKEVDATKQWACEFEIPGNPNLSDYKVREVVKNGENNYNPVNSEEYIKLGNYIYQVTYSDSEKTETNKEKLGGAEFKITGPDNYEETVTTPSEGENKGVITISDLLPGEYVITETKAPANYNLLANPITVVVGTTEGESASSGFTVVGDSNTHYYYDLKMEITNNKLFDMPAAGGGFRATIFGVGIMIIAGGWYIIRRRRRII